MRHIPLLVSLLVGCAKAPGPPVAPAAHPAPHPYLAALADASVPLPGEVVTDLVALAPGAPGVTWDDQGRALVTTWSRAQYYDERYVPGFSFPLYGETWFTAGDEVASACAGLAGDALSLRVSQLLGLPPDGGRDVFVRVWIDPTDLFRPCANPAVDTTTCPLAAPLQVDDQRVVTWSCRSDDPHQRWLCATWVERYGASDSLQRYPWTALGYTYDWGRPDDPVGASEFVAPGGVQVELEALVPNAAFCAP